MSRARDRKSAVTCAASGSRFMCSPGEGAQSLKLAIEELQLFRLAPVRKIVFRESGGAQQAGHRSIVIIAVLADIEGRQMESENARLGDGGAHVHLSDVARAGFPQGCFQNFEVFDIFGGGRIAGSCSRRASIRLTSCRQGSRGLRSMALCASIGAEDFTQAARCDRAELRARALRIRRG